MRVPVFLFSILCVFVCMKKGHEDVVQSCGLLLQSDRSALLAMMEYQTHSSTLITNGLTGNDDGRLLVQSSSVIIDYFNIVVWC